MDLIKVAENQFKIKKEFPVFKAGDTITVHYKIIEGNKERIQQYRGVVLQRQGSGMSETFTVRKMSGNVGVERIFPVNSPFIDKIEVNKHGRVRRAKIFYFRGLTGKKARIQERRMKYSENNIESEGTSIEPEEKFNEPQEISSKSEESNIKPQEISSKSEEGNNEPEETSSKSEEGNNEPQEISSKSEEGNNKPEETSSKSEEGNNEPEEISSKSEEGNIKPQEISGKSEEGNNEPEEILDKSEEIDNKQEESDIESKESPQES